MRITTKEHEAIVALTQRHFGKDARVMLFGSRVNVEAKGGDIDLLIIPNTKVTIENLVKQKITYKVALADAIGDQKLDVLVQYPADNRPIIATAMKTGIEL